MTTTTDPLRSMQQENSRLRLENTTLRGELAALRCALTALRELQEKLETIDAHTDVVALISQILSTALEAVNSENGSLILVDGETQELAFAEVQGASRNRLLGYRLKSGEGIAGWSIQNRTAVLVPDVNLDPRFSPAVDNNIGFRTRSIICVPLVGGSRSIGALEAVNTNSGRPFNEKDLDMFLIVARLASEAILRAEGYLVKENLAQA